LTATASGDKHPAGTIKERMRATQSQKAIVFKALHERSTPLLIPNPWDVGSVRILASLGFEALTTSSGASAGIVGLHDGEVSLEKTLGQVREMVAATDLPVAGDLGKGFGDAPGDVARTIRLAAESGLVGGSIEDATGDKGNPIYSFEDALARVEAAVAAARSLAFPFMLVARSENFLRGIPDLQDTIKRLQAFERAGADVLFAPGLPDIESVRAVCAAVKKPVNFMVGMPGKSFSVRELTDAGVRRISLGSSLYRTAMGGLVEAAREVKEQGTFRYIDRALRPADLNQLIQG
jgi:2-methylisocitrate lyase-like PEP mutase family enzyme